MNIEAIKEAASKVNEAVERLVTLIKEGAVKEDIDAQKAVITLVIHQFKEVTGIEPMPEPGTAA